MGPSSDRDAAPSHKVIYDLGSNDGSDIAYYLLKADKVVAVEAVPSLAAGIRQRFAAEIAEGRVVVENGALTDDPSLAEVPFYVHRSQDLLSQLPRPAESEQHNFRVATLPAVTIAELVRRHGAPFYVKIDLEGYDNVVLNDLFAQRIFPPYISAEAHDIDVFCTLVARGGYNAFKIVIGEYLERDYGSHVVETKVGRVNYSFPAPHSSGPFGNDIKGPWKDGAEFMRYFAQVGPGWVDIHASRLDRPSPTKVGKGTELAATVLRHLGMRLGRPSLLRAGDRLWGIG